MKGVPTFNESLGLPHRVWGDDPSTFTTRKIQRLHHTYHTHPLMQMDELAALARELYPRDLCRFIRPGTTQKSSFTHDPQAQDGRTIDEVFRRIEESGSWVALYNIENIPRYQAFLAEVIGTVRPFIERDQGKIFLMTGFIFISGPPSVTPFHIDRENNFWLQIHGRKVMNVWDNTDRFVVPAEVVEDFILFRADGPVRLKDEFVARSHEFDVGPGDGVYFPSTSPHMTRSDVSWVKPGDGVSVSIGVNFYTDLTRRFARVHQFNQLTRRILKGTPVPPGVSPILDSIKAPIGRALAPLRYRRLKVEPPPGAY